MKRGVLAAVIGLASVIIVVLLIRNSGPGAGGQGDAGLSGYTGSSPCRGCHERFYDLWAPSHHGLAMQPVTAEFIESEIQPFEEGLEIGRSRFRVKIKRGAAWVVETWNGQEREFRLQHAMGGKNVYYFLTELDRGRLQVLPLGYDVRRNEWFDAPASMVRHVTDASEEPVLWTDRLLTFNTSCYNCHVSQLQTNYDLATDSYQTVWGEPGINCETCHGGAEEHIRVCEEAGKGEVPEDLKIISVKAFDKDELNSLCTPCHAKSHVLTTDFTPGDRYFDHFGLTTFEDPDFYPDGRDLGENFTMTLWLTSPCLEASDLDCLHCHTSSGRFRQKDQPNEACLPCHQDKVADPSSHAHHEADSPGSQCISCHMPMTEFARMRRSDHSMRPPTPAATMEFGSPNACNLCHEDRDAAWADGWVRKWRSRDYQAPVLRRARLVRDAREGDWQRLPEMLAYIEDKDRDAVFATSLIRLMETNVDERIEPTLLRALEDRSPLVRAAAAEALAHHQTVETRDALLAASGDEYRVVRIATASALSAFPAEAFQGVDLGNLPNAIADYEAYLDVRPDDWLSHYNRGNYYLNIGKPRLAIDAYETAHRLDPSYYPPLVNASIAYNQIGENDKAEESLRAALQLEPYSGVVWLNLALLLGEQGRREEALEAFGRVFGLDSTSAVAAYNLAVLNAETDMDEAVKWSGRAAKLDPGTPRYAFTYGYYLNRSGDTGRACRVLEKSVRDHPGYVDSYLLLGDIYLLQGKRAEAMALFERGLKAPGMSADGRSKIAARLEATRNG